MPDTVPVPAPAESPQVTAMRKLFEEAKTQYGFLSGLTSKKFALSFISAFMLGGIALSSAHSDGTFALWLFGFASAIVCSYVVGQSIVDAARAIAIGQGVQGEGE